MTLEREQFWYWSFIRFMKFIKHSYWSLCDFWKKKFLFLVIEIYEIHMALFCQRFLLSILCEFLGMRPIFSFTYIFSFLSCFNFSWFITSVCCNLTLFCIGESMFSDQNWRPKSRSLWTAESGSLSWPQQHQINLHSSQWTGSTTSLESNTPSIDSLRH